MAMELKPYKGYVVMPRAILLPFLEDDQLNFTSLGAYIALVIESDWDIKHSTYGCLTKSDPELAIRWNCNITTVWRHKNRLLKRGLLIPHGDYVRIKHYELFDPGVAKQLAKIPIASTQDLIAYSQDPIAQLQEKIASLQKSPDQNQPQSFNVSSKGNLGVSNEDYEDFSDEELDRISDEIDKQILEGK